MADIILSAGVRSNLLALQQSSDLIGTAQNRLATGKKVNSALDNPASFFLSNAFRSSANNLSSLLDGISNGQRTLEAANSGITALTALIGSANAALASALASAPTTAVQTGTVSNLTAASSFATTVGKTITVSDGVTVATYTTVGAATTVAQIMTAVNGTALETVKAELSGSGQLQFEAQGATTITIGGTISAPELLQFGHVAGVTAAGTLNATRTAAAAQYNALRTQIDQLAADSGYNGVSLLNGGGVKINFNEKATAFLNVVGNADTSTGLGILASGGNLQTNFDIATSQAATTAALSTLKDQSATLASYVSITQARTDFTNSQINTLNIGADFLVQADSNQEGANLLALQTRAYPNRIRANNRLT